MTEAMKMEITGSTNRIGWKVTWPDSSVTTSTRFFDSRTDAQRDLRRYLTKRRKAALEGATSYGPPIG